MPELEEDLVTIRREVVEARAQTIKIHNQLGSLAADVKTLQRAVVGKEQGSQVRHWLAVGGGVLALLGVVKLAWDARIASATAETQAARESAGRLEAELKELKGRVSHQLEAQAKASELYALLGTDKKAEALDLYATMSKDDLTRTEAAFFAAAIERLRSDLSVKAYHLGLEHLRYSRWHEAALALDESVRNAPEGAHTPGAKLALARAYRKLARQRDAIALLMPLAESTPDKSMQDDAALELAQAYVDLQSFSEARATLREFLRKSPRSMRANDARDLLGDILDQ